MKPFAVILAPKNEVEYWFRVPNVGRIREVCGFCEGEDINEKSVFFDTEDHADSYIEYILRINPGRTYLKMSTMAVCKITLGPINKAVFQQNNLLPT